MGHFICISLLIKSLKLKNNKFRAKFIRKKQIVKFLKKISMTKPKIETLNNNALSINTLIITSAKIIAWLGASVAGFSLILGTFGYLVIYSHDTTILGLDVSLRTSLEYIVTGAIFFQDTGYIGIISNGLSINLIPSFIIFASFIILYTWFKNNKIFKVAKVVILLGLVIVQIIVICHIINTLKGQNYLIYKLEKNDINDYIIHQKFEELRFLYGSIAAPILINFATIVFIVYCYLKDSLHNLNFTYFFRNQVSFIIIIIVPLFISIYGLPLSYGVLMKGNYYPQLIEYGLKANEPNPLNLSCISHDQKYKLGNNSNYYVIYHSDKEFVVYDKSFCQLIYIDRKIISYYRIGASYNVFSGRKDLDEYKINNLKEKDDKAFEKDSLNFKCYVLNRFTGLYEDTSHLDSARRSFGLDYSR